MNVCCDQHGSDANRKEQPSHSLPDRTKGFDTRYFSFLKKPQTRIPYGKAEELDHDRRVELSVGT